MTVTPPANPALMVADLNGNLNARDRSGIFALTGTGALRWQPAENARVNLAINTRAANNSNEWGALTAGTTVTRVVDARFVGGTALRVVCDGGNLSDGMIQNRTNLAPNVNSDQTQLTVSFDIIVESGHLDVLLAGGFGTLASGGGVSGGGGAANFSVSTYGTLERKSLTATIGANKNDTTKLVFYITSNKLQPVTFLISNIVLEYGSVPNATYFDGSYSGCSWLDPRTGQLGSAHASPSCNQVTAWIEEGITNLVFNPSVEYTNTSGINGTAGTTVTKDSTTAWLGAASIKCVTAGSGNQEGITFNSLNGLGYTGTAKTFTGSVYVRGSGNVSVWLRINYTDVTLTDTHLLNVTLTNSWQRIVLVSLTSDPAKTINNLIIHIRTNGTQAITFYADCAQIEEKSYATSFCDGSIGVGYSWSGTAHASSSTRANSGISTSSDNRIGLKTGSQVTRFVRTGEYNSTPFLIDGGLRFTGKYIATYIQTSPNSKLSHQSRTNNSGASSLVVGNNIAIGTYLRSYTAQNPGLVRVAYLASGVTNDTPRPDYVESALELGGTLSIGGYSSGDLQLNGCLGPVITYAAELSNTRRLMVDSAISGNKSRDELWALFEEWEAIGNPVDLLALGTGNDSAGVSSEGQPLDLLHLSSGSSSAGVTSIGLPLELDFSGQPAVVSEPSIGQLNMKIDRMLKAYAGDTFRASVYDLERYDVSLDPASTVVSIRVIDVEGEEVTFDYMVNDDADNWYCDLIAPTQVGQYMVEYTAIVGLAIKRMRTTLTVREYPRQFS